MDCGLGWKGCSSRTRWTIDAQYYDKSFYNSTTPSSRGRFCQDLALLSRGGSSSFGSHPKTISRSVCFETSCPFSRLASSVVALSWIRSTAGSPATGGFCGLVVVNYSYLAIRPCCARTPSRRSCSCRGGFGSITAPPCLTTRNTTMPVCPTRSISRLGRERGQGTMGSDAPGSYFFFFFFF